MSGASIVFLQRVVNPVEYIALENRWSPWRFVEWCGLALCSYITLESTLCTMSPLENDTCNLESRVDVSLVWPTSVHVGCL
jgi:hypothetical protein